MDNSIYLDDVAKDAYMDDFDLLLNNNTVNKFWQIDNDNLSRVLGKINKNRFIQTLYSKSYSHNNNLSYLIFTYAQSVELEIFREILPLFMSTFNDEVNYHQSVCYYEFSYPKQNPNHTDEVKLGIMCTDDPNYFNVNHITLSLKSELQEIHNQFLELLSDKLCVL